MDTKTNIRILEKLLEIGKNEIINPIPLLAKQLPDLTERIIHSGLREFYELKIIDQISDDETIRELIIEPTAIGYLRKLQELKSKNNTTIQNFYIDTNNGAVGTNTNVTINNRNR